MNQQLPIESQVRLRLRRRRCWKMGGSSVAAMACHQQALWETGASQVLSVLPDMVNAELVLGTIQTRQETALG